MSSETLFISGVLVACAYGLGQVISIVALLEDKEDMKAWRAVGAVMLLAGAVGVGLLLRGLAQ